MNCRGLGFRAKSVGNGCRRCNTVAVDRDHTVVGGAETEGHVCGSPTEFDQRPACHPSGQYVLAAAGFFAANHQPTNRRLLGRPYSQAAGAVLHQPFFPHARWRALLRLHRPHRRWWLQRVGRGRQCGGLGSPPFLGPSERCRHARSGQSQETPKRPASFGPFPAKRLRPIPHTRSAHRELDCQLRRRWLRLGKIRVSSAFERRMGKIGGHGRRTSAKAAASTDQGGSLFSDGTVVEKRQDSSLGHKRLE